MTTPPTERSSVYDVVIVGARCAGATLAVYLARAGASVLLLDRDTLPSDHILSTHTIHPPGMDILDDVGVGDAVRAVAPAMRIVRLSKAGAAIDVQHRDGRAEYCPRRKRLDRLLQQAAVAAGATLHDRARVTDLVWLDGRVSGVRAVLGDGEHVFSAHLVVGADGRHSTVAKLVQAREYFGYDAPRACYWAYWKTPACWRTDPAYPFDMYVGYANGDARVIFQTDNDELLISSAPEVEQAKSWRADPLAALRADLESDPLTRPLIQGAEPASEVRGTLKERYFFREAAGRGWMLLGDAGHHKEFLVGDGITEALLQARSGARAVAAGSDDALVEWWRARDVEAMPLFFFAQDEGRAGPPLELQRVLFAQVSKQPRLLERMAQVMEHQLSPYEAFPLSAVVRWTVGAALRGRPGVLREFFMMGKRGSAVAREVRLRRNLLAEAAQSRAPDPSPVAT